MTDEISDAELRALRDRAKADGDDALRRLIASFISQRALLGDVVELIETQFGGSTVANAPVLKRAREVVRRSTR